MSSSSEAEGPTPSKRKNYDLKFKLEVVEYAEKHNKSKAARDKKVPRSCVKDWAKQKEELKKQLKTSLSNSKTPAKRLEGAGRKLKDSEFDAQMIEWVRQQRAKKLRVSRTIIQNKALKLSTDEEFKVGSFLKFKINFVFRQATDGSTSL